MFQLTEGISRPDKLLQKRTMGPFPSLYLPLNYAFVSSHCLQCWNIFQQSSRSMPSFCCLPKEIQMQWGLHRFETDQKIWTGIFPTRAVMDKLRHSWKWHPKEEEYVVMFTGVLIWKAGNHFHWEPCATYSWCTTMRALLHLYCCIPLLDL